MGGIGVPVGDPNKVIEMKIKATLAELTTIRQQLAELADWFSEYVSGQVLKDVKDKKRELEDSTVETHKQETQVASKARERDSRHMEIIRSSLNTIADVGVGYVKKTFGLVEMVFNQLKKSSPLLQAIEQLFNLAWMLFFMPIGNKLGEMLIPAVIQLMDDVMEIWDAFEGMSLGEMLSYAVSKGAEMLGDFINNIGETLKDQGGFIGSIASMLLFIGDFIKNHGENMLNVVGGIASFIMTYLKEIVALIIAFKAMSYTMGLMQIIATYASESLINKLSGGLLGTTLGIAGSMMAISGAVGIGAGALSYGMMAGAFAEGGHVDAAPGGRLAIVGEGGEGEWIIPDSKMGEMGGNTYNITIQSYSTEELTSKVQSIVSGQISASRLRSGF